MKKALKIGIVCLLALLGIFSIIAYILWKEQTTYIFECIIDFINRPLPIIGVSIAIIGAFVFKCFVASKYGKKALADYQKALDETKQELAIREKALEEVENFLKAELERFGLTQDKIKEVLEKSLEMSKNIKIQALANELKGETYGEEETNCDQEEETL